MLYISCLGTLLVIFLSKMKAIVLLCLERLYFKIERIKTNCFEEFDFNLGSVSSINASIVLFSSSQYILFALNNQKGWNHV